jgi:hypothetical protein
MEMLISSTCEREACASVWRSQSLPRQAQSRPQSPISLPRRSYSVTGCNSALRSHQPSLRLRLSELSPELHYAIFEFLDPLDSTCLGLTNHRFYEIHRHLHGTVPLSIGRVGPNDMEWAWRLAGCQGSRQICGGGFCRKCGAVRCELHRHIQDWIGEGYEYCAIKDRFGLPSEGGKNSCFRNVPKDPHKCGRHTNWIP